MHAKRIVHHMAILKIGFQHTNRKQKQCSAITAQRNYNQNIILFVFPASAVLRGVQFLWALGRSFVAQTNSHTHTHTRRTDLTQLYRDREVITIKKMRPKWEAHAMRSAPRMVQHLPSILSIRMGATMRARNCPNIARKLREIDHIKITKLRSAGTIYFSVCDNKTSCENSTQRAHTNNTKYTAISGAVNWGVFFRCLPAGCHILLSSKFEKRDQRHTDAAHLWLVT